ncbi:MAG: ABC transporter ATP-binding protein [Treponemataceae bacterium]|nr:ABC transporter ATP-binding protein [Treponemataceae bacterium]
MIILENVSKVYKSGEEQIHALRNVSLSIADKDFIAVTGPSGSGKTTLLNIIGMMDIITSGKVMVDGTDYTSASEKELCIFRKKELGFIFQNYNLVSVFNVYENIESALLISDDNIKAAEKKIRINKMIKNVGLTEFKSHLPSELSGGQKQRVAIARALIKHPHYIIADEPTANLDTKNAFEILNIMMQINKQIGTTFIISTHDERLLKNISKKITLVDGALA